MWPYDYINPMIPYFEGAKQTAANVLQPGEHGDYTADMFREDFPQFYNRAEASGEESDAPPTVTVTSLLPDAMLQTFIGQANDSVLPSRWGSMWRYAAGLYVAHFAAMYLKTYSPSSDSASQVANGASQVGVVKTATMGDTSIGYDNSAITAGTEKWGTWNATQYGAQLVTMARMVGMGGVYAI